MTESVHFYMGISAVRLSGSIVGLAPAPGAVEITELG